MAGKWVERLDHLVIVAGVCQEIGLAAHLDALAGPSQRQVSVGTATVATVATVAMVAMVAMVAHVGSPPQAWERPVNR